MRELSSTGLEIFSIAALATLFLPNSPVVVLPYNPDIKQNPLRTPLPRTSVEFWQVRQGQGI